MAHSTTISKAEDQGFKCMVGVPNPGHTLPPRTDFTKPVERKFQAAFQNVKDAVIANESRITFTVDTWICKATETYLGITWHYIEEG